MISAFQEDRLGMCGWRTVGRNADQEVVLSVFVCESLAQKGGRDEESLANSIQKTCTVDLLCVRRSMRCLRVEG